MTGGGGARPAAGFEGCGAAVLCGGRSRRLGADKALHLLNRDGRRHLAAVAEKLAEVFGEVILVTNDRRKLASCPDLQPFAQVEDQRPGVGPVGGILTALNHLSPRLVFVLACDMPTFDRALAGKLIGLARAGAQAALPRHGGRLEPLYAVYGPGAAPVFARGLDEGRFAVRENLGRMTTAYWEEPEPGAGGIFANLNTLDEVRRAGFSLGG